MLACFIPIYSSRWQVCDLIEQFHRIFLLQRPMDKKSPSPLESGLGDAERREIELKKAAWWGGEMDFWRRGCFLHPNYSPGDRMCDDIHEFVQILLRHWQEPKKPPSPLGSGLGGGERERV